MKNLHCYFLLSFIFLFSCCDVIDNPVIDFGSYRNDLYGPPPTFTPLETAVQRVLLEDFTGHECGNCPAAHLVASAILESHEEHLALVAVHAGTLAAPFGSLFSNDYRTPEGEYYLLTQIGTDLLPTGRVNRGGGASNDLTKSEWESAVEDELLETAIVDLQIEADYVAENQHLNVHVSSEWFAAASGNFKLVILISEDSIISPQLNYFPSNHVDTNYVHLHMLRGSLSGATGLSVANNPTSNTASVSSFTYDWNLDWHAEHAEVIALITNGDNGEILNVTKKKLIE